MIVQKLLDHMGYDTTLAYDGEQALKEYEEKLGTDKAYDVVVLDLTIPGGMGGKETIKKLLEIDPDVKAIVTSGYSNDPVLSNYADYGFKDYILKPFNAGSFSKIINKLILKETEL